MKNSRFFAAFSKLLKPMLSAFVLVIATINMSTAITGVDQYKVSYYPSAAASASEAITSGVIQFGEPYQVLGADTFSKSDYVLYLWNEATNGPKTFYTPGATISLSADHSFLSSQTSGGITTGIMKLSPIWAPSNNTIKLGTDNLYTTYGEGVYLDEDRIHLMMPKTTTDPGSNPYEIQAFTRTIYYFDDNVIKALRDYWATHNWSSEYGWWNDNTYDQCVYTGILNENEPLKTTVLNSTFYGIYNHAGDVQYVDADGYITPAGDEFGKNSLGQSWFNWYPSYGFQGFTVWTPPTRPGYSFVGWYIPSFWNEGATILGSMYKVANGDETAPETVKDWYSYSDNISFVGQWTGNTITLNWDNNGHNNAKINIPSEYTPVEYIESHGSQIVNTNINGAAKWELTAKGVAGNLIEHAILVGNGESDATWFGGYGDKAYGAGGIMDYVAQYFLEYPGTIEDIMAYWCENSEEYCDFSNTAFTDISNTTKANISIDFEPNGIISGMVNAKPFYSFPNDLPNTFANPYKLFGFGDNHYFKGKLYSAKAIQNNQLVFNGIPVKRTVDGVDEYGLYDTVSGQFFGNSGTGAFTGGNEISISAPDSCVYGTTFTMPVALTDSGYTFTNWSVNGKTFNANTIEVECNYENLGVYDGSATIKANWTENPTYTIGLDAETNGGTPNCTLYEKYNTDWQDDPHDECWIASSEGVTALQITPIKQNSIFKGYYTDANGDSQIIDDNGIILVGTDYFNDDATVYAQFADCVKPSGGANTVESWGLYISEMNQCYWDAACAPNYTSDTFIRIDGADVPGVTVYSAPGVPTTTEPMPDCRPNVYDITLNHGGLEDHVYEKYGTGWYHDSETHTPVNSENPENIPTVDGMKFRGYYTTPQDAVNAGVSCTPQQISEGTCSVSAPVIERSVAYANDGHSAETSRTLVLPSNTTFTADTTLYAAWAFDCEDTTPASHAHCALYIGTNGYVQYETFCDDGYALVSGTENTYNPQCVEDETYNVMFEKNAEDAVGSKESVTCSVNTDCVVTNNNEITRPDYDFIGWSTSPTGTTVEYTTNINKSTTDDVTLYAVWQPACVHVLHVGTGSLCLYKDRISPAGNPSLAISLDGHNTYYAAMSLSDLSMSETSTQKLHIKYGENIYNVHDLTVIE